MEALLYYYDRYRDLVDDWQAFREALAAPLPTCVWTNTLRVTAEALRRCLDLELGAPVEAVPWYPGAFRWPRQGVGPLPMSPGRTLAYAQGLFLPQEEAALLPALLLAPQPGERLLDLCAAPGNKTAQLAVALGGTGTVVANDLSRARVSPLRRTLERMGILNVVATAGNGVVFPADPRHGLYHGVLVDVPCSCDATVRKSPKVMLRQDEGRRRRTAGVQRALLRRAIALCQPGGRVVYSTCSFAPEENEAVVNDVLADPLGPRAGTPGWDGLAGEESGRGGEAPRVSLRSIAVPGLRLSPGVPAWAGVEFHPEVARKTLRLWPHHNDTGGFFVAVFDVQGPEGPPLSAKRERTEACGGAPGGPRENRP